MIKKRIQDAFNKQIGEEMYSSYLYLSMAAYFDAMNLAGFSNWMRLQAQEEMFHAMRFYHHIIERGGKVELGHLEGPKLTWDSPLNAFEDALAHEEHITACIHKLMDLSVEEKDYPSRSLLQWFVDEQIEEEANATQIVEKLTMIGTAKHLTLMLDSELKTRVAGVNPYDAQAVATGAAK